jgi:glycosyltransferase involved in cell wall biosynthesis
MADITVIVLTHNEEANLPDLLVSVAPLEGQVYVVDSGSTDRTREIAESAGCTVIDHSFEGYAVQRNWTFDNLPVASAWTLCLDADERLTRPLAEEIVAVTEDRQALEAYLLRKRTLFMGRWIRYGGQYPSYHLRLFRSGRGRCEDRLYDQHFVTDGRIGRLRNDYIDVITSNLSTWVERHNRWAKLEALELARGGTGDARVTPKLTGTAVERKRFLRQNVYGRAPLFLRAFALFIFDYVFRLGFLDGRPGLVFFVLQRFWFRFLTDAMIMESQLKPAALPLAPPACGETACRKR